MKKREKGEEFRRRRWRGEEEGEGTVWLRGEILVFLALVVGKKVLVCWKFFEASSRIFFRVALKKKIVGKEESDRRWRSFGAEART